MASVQEIAVQKAYTIGRRGEYRDYFDLYTILQENVMTLNTIIKTAEDKYGNIFNSKLFLEQLVYFDDLLTLEIIPFDSAELPHPQEVKAYFEKAVKSYLSKGLQ